VVFLEILRAFDLSVAIGAVDGSWMVHGIYAAAWSLGGGWRGAASFAWLT
jgi:hypothetical protein